MVIAVDFDNTITDDTPYPVTGNIRLGCREALEWLQHQGHMILLYTARRESALDEAIQLVREWELPIIVPDRYAGYGLDKVEADVYIDDRNFGVDKVDWFDILNKFKMGDV